MTVRHHMTRSLAVHSRIRETVGGRADAPEALAVEMYARGLSVRDIEALLADEAGNRHCIPNLFIQQGPDLDPKEPRQLL